MHLFESNLKHLFTRFKKREIKQLVNHLPQFTRQKGYPEPEKLSRGPGLWGS